MKTKLMAIFLAVALICCSAVSVSAAEEVITIANTLDLPVKSAVLMEQSTGKILYAQNETEKMPPASITKIMTLLLVMEEIAAKRLSLQDTVTCSPHAASMGGSQIWLEPGEQMSVEDLLKATCVNSANDASVALGEQIAGSEEAFVARMNERAKELGMTDTTFQNATGLDADGHLTTARDIAVMSSALLNYPEITTYTTIWTDTLRDGETELTNTNRLVRFYAGCTGLKTGTTDGAGCCVSASAKRENMEVIAVVMGADNSNDRFLAARKLLDYAFANYACYTVQPRQDLLPILVKHGVAKQVAVESATAQKVVIPKGKASEVTETVTISDTLTAPIKSGQTVGQITVSFAGETLCEVPITTCNAVEKRTFFSAFCFLMQLFFST